MTRHRPTSQQQKRASAATPAGADSAAHFTSGEQPLAVVAELLNAAHDGMLVVDASGTITFANRAIETILGYPVADVLGSPLEVLVPVRHHATHAAHAARFGADGTSTRGRHTALLPARHRDGHEVYVDVTLNRAPAGAPGLTLAIVRDPSVRLEGERELRELLERFQRVAHASHDALFDWDPSGGTTWFGDALVQFFAHSPAQARDRDWWESCLHPDDRARVIAHFDGCRLAQVSSCREEYRFARGDGGYATILHRSFMWYDDEGTLVRAVGALMDISAQRAAEASRSQLALEHQRVTDRLQLILDTMPIGCVLLDSADRITYWNRGAEQIFGWRMDEVIGQTLESIGTSSMMGLGQSPVFPAQGDAAIATTSTHWRQGGTEVHCEWTRVPVLDASGAREGCLAMVQDITARRSLEWQLTQAQKMEALGRLAGGVAHDFNNLLTAILANDDLLGASLAPDDPRLVDVEEIRHAALRAAALTRQLLLFARRQPNAPRVVDLNHAVEGIERMLARILGAEIRTHVQPAAGPLHVSIDPSQFEQLLLNLAVNARDAMPAGGALIIRLAAVSGETLAPRLHVSPAALGYAHVEVLDSGTGIDPALFSRIFEPLFTTKDESRGTGLGLSICQGVVERAGGAMEVRNRADGGAAFSAYLPLTSEVPDPVDTLPPVLPLGRGEVIVLVEDDDAVKNAMSRALRDAGFRVHAAGDRDEALAVTAVLQEGIDVLVTDVRLPGQDGIALAASLRRLCPVSHVIFVTGYADELHVGAAAGMPDAILLHKPLLMHELVATIHKLLDTPRDTLGTPSSGSRAISRTPAHGDDTEMTDTSLQYLRAYVQSLPDRVPTMLLPEPAGDDVESLGRSIADLGRRLANRQLLDSQLAVLSREMLQGLYLDQVLDHMYEGFRPLIPYDRIGCALLEDDGRFVRARWARTESTEVELLRGFEASMAGSSLAEIVATGRPRIINDIKKHAEQRGESHATRLILAEGMRSSLTCPLIAQGRPIGFLFFSSRMVGAYAAVHVEVFQRLAELISGLVERSALYEQLTTANAALREARDELAILATHDALTGIWNRRAILGFLDELLDKARRQEASGAVLIADIDHFKQFNDVHGHLVGDAVLRAVAQRLSGTIRAGDRVGRFGGEEFLVCVDKCTREGALTFAERLVTEMRATPVIVDGVSHEVRLSVGAAHREALGSSTSARLIEEADAALYSAKRDGRDRAVLEVEE